MKINLFVKPENRQGLRIVKKAKSNFVMDKDCFDSWYDFDSWHDLDNWYNFDSWYDVDCGYDFKEVKND